MGTIQWAPVLPPLVDLILSTVSLVVASLAIRKAKYLGIVLERSIERQIGVLQDVSSAVSATLREARRVTHETPKKPRPRGRRLGPANQAVVYHSAKVVTPKKGKK